MIDKGGNNMKKIAVLFSILSIALFINTECLATTLEVNGEKMNFTNNILIDKGISYMPIREFFEKKGFSVEWNSKNDSISVFSNKLPLYGSFEENSGNIEKNINYEFCGYSDGLIYDETMKKCNLADTVIYDAELAADIGSAHLKKEIEAWGGEEQVIVTTRFNSDLNEWYVSYKNKDNLHSHHDSAVIVLDANTGSVLRCYQGY